MNKLIIAFTIILMASNSYAQKSRAVSTEPIKDAGIIVSSDTEKPETMPLEELVAKIKIAKDHKEKTRHFNAISGFTPKTGKDVDSLFAAMHDNETAAYARMAIVRIHDKPFGPDLHRGLRKLKADLRHKTELEFKALSSENQNKAMAEAMDIAAVVTAIGEAGYKEAIPDLRDLLDYDEEFQGYISMSASIALGQLGDEKSFNKIMGDLSSRKNISAAGYGPRGVRKIVEKLDEINNTIKVNPVKLGDPRNNDIENLSRRLAKMGKKDPEMKQALRQLLNYDHYKVRRAVAEALMWSMDANDKDITLEMLKHKDDIVRMIALRSLRVAKTWDKSFLPIIIDIFQNDPDQGVRGVAVSELGSLAGSGVRRKDLQEAVPYLEAALKNPHLASTASHALRALTGRYYPYEGMWPLQKKWIEMQPEYQPEDETRVFK